MATFQANVRSGSKRSLKSCKAAQQSKLSLQTQLETKVRFIFKTRSMRWKRGFERTWIEKQKRLERFCEIMAPDFAWKNLKIERLLWERFDKYCLLQAPCRSGDYTRSISQSQVQNPLIETLHSTNFNYKFQVNCFCPAINSKEI